MVALPMMVALAMAVAAQPCPQSNLSSSSL
jgi:hypothetical protein